MTRRYVSRTLVGGLVAAIAAAGAFGPGACPAAAQAALLVGGGGVAGNQIPNAAHVGSLGYNALVGIGFDLPFIPLAFRVDGQFDQWASPAGLYRFRVLSGTANVVYFIPTAVLQPYVVAGTGYYHLIPRRNGIDTPSNGLGVNAGVGVKAGLGALGVFGEWRYHYIPNTGAGHTSYAPFTFGVSF
jgi:hypothetical protein